MFSKSLKVKALDTSPTFGNDIAAPCPVIQLPDISKRTDLHDEYRLTEVVYAVVIEGPVAKNSCKMVPFPGP